MYRFVYLSWWDLAAKIFPVTGVGPACSSPWLIAGSSSDCCATCTCEHEHSEICTHDVTSPHGTDKIIVSSSRLASSCQLSRRWSFPSRSVWRSLVPTGRDNRQWHCHHSQPKGQRSGYHQVPDSSQAEWTHEIHNRSSINLHTYYTNLGSTDDYFYGVANLLSNVVT